MDSSNDEYSDGDISSSSSSSYSSPSSSYATYTASPKWRPLADVWVFDLVKLQWKERIQYPQLARSYHSLVGCGDGTVAAFGGYQQDNNIGGEVCVHFFAITSEQWIHLMLLMLLRFVRLNCQNPTLLFIAFFITSNQYSTR